MGKRHDAEAVAAKDRRRSEAIYTGLFHDLARPLKGQVESIDKLVLINRGYEVFFVINASAPDGTPMVAFDSAECGFAGLAKVFRKVAADGYRWRVDKPKPRADEA